MFRLRCTRWSTPVWSKRTHRRNSSPLNSCRYGIAIIMRTEVLIVHSRKCRCAVQKYCYAYREFTQISKLSTAIQYRKHCYTEKYWFTQKNFFYLLYRLENASNYFVIPSVTTISTLSKCRSFEHLFLQRSHKLNVSTSFPRETSSASASPEPPDPASTSRPGSSTWASTPTAPGSSWMLPRSVSFSSPSKSHLQFFLYPNILT